MDDQGVRRRGAARAWIERAVLALALILALWALRDVEFRALAPRFGAAAWIAIAALFALSTALTFLPSWLFVRRSGHRVPFAGFAGVMLASQAVNATNPLRMGFPMRVYLLRERYGVATGTASLLIPLEGFMAIAVAAAAACLAPLRAAGHAGAVLALAGLACALAAILLGRLAARGALPVPAWLPERIRRGARALIAASAHLTPAGLGAFAVLFLASDIAVAGILKLAAQATGFEASLTYLLAAYCGAYLVGIGSLMPQGLGTRDAALGFLLHAAGASSEQAAAAVLVVRGATTGLAFLAGILAASLMGLSRRGAAGGNDRSKEAAPVPAGGKAPGAGAPR
jgi:uncharacterized membrane protein YbhN (UPF0104 family)